MTISRLLILQALLFCGLGTIFFIPRQTQIEPCRVRMELPYMLAGLIGKPAEVTPQEHEMLAEDTEFCRKIYDDGFGEQVLVSIVLSGHDLDNSIHRPERCLRAQGWDPVASDSLNIPVPSAPGGQLPVTRLHNVTTLRGPDGQPVRGPDGQLVTIHDLNYYWFVGYTDITASHFEREYLDIKDRLMHGYNQRWAYITVEAKIMKGFIPYGKDEEQTNALLQNVIAEVYPQIVKEKGDSPQ
jgi:hypothetical protein